MSTPEKSFQRSLLEKYTAIYGPQGQALQYEQTMAVRCTLPPRTRETDDIYKKEGEKERRDVTEVPVRTRKDEDRDEEEEK